MNSMLKEGLLQASVVPPLLFTVFINSLVDCKMNRRTSTPIRAILLESVTDETMSVWRSGYSCVRAIECSQSAAWTSNRCLSVASRVKAFLGRPNNSGSTLPRAVLFKDCDRVSSVSLSRTWEVPRHFPTRYQPLLAFFPNACQSPPASLPHPIYHSYD